MAQKMGARLGKCALLLRALSAAQRNMIEKK
jgi:hypothetical protein